MVNQGRISNQRYAFLLKNIELQSDLQNNDYFKLFKFEILRNDI